MTSFSPFFKSVYINFLHRFVYIYRSVFLMFFFFELCKFSALENLYEYFPRVVLNSDRNEFCLSVFLFLLSWYRFVYFLFVNSISYCELCEVLHGVVLHFFSEHFTIGMVLGG